MATKKRARIEYSDPEVLNPPGVCLRDDGVYRRRVGWPQRPELLNEWELANLGPAGEDRRLRPGEREKIGTRGT